MNISTGLCRELAGLARLSLSDAEAELFAGQLERIVEYLQQLQGVDVQGVEEFALGDTEHGLRVDDPAPGWDPEAALAGAPAVRGGHIVVPKFMED